MISSLENGPTEEDLELLLGGGGSEEPALFVDLREEQDELDDIDYSENHDELNVGGGLKRASGRRKKDGSYGQKAARPKKKGPKRRKHRPRGDFDAHSVGSDDFVVPDDEEIPPDWEYNFEQPIVCQNATFYNKVDSILTGSASGDEHEPGGRCELDEGLARDSTIHSRGPKRKKSPAGVGAGAGGINIDKDYIDDRDNTTLIVESRLVGDELDEDEQMFFAGASLSSFLRKSDKASTDNQADVCKSEPVVEESGDLTLDGRASNCGILDICLETMRDLDEFEACTASQMTERLSLDLECDEASCLLIVFKSVDIEFSSLLDGGGGITSSGCPVTSSLSLIKGYLDFFHGKISNSPQIARELSSSFLKELHSEMIGFAESKLEEISKSTPVQLGGNVLFLFLQVLGLTLLVEDLLIQAIRAERLRKPEDERPHVRAPILFGSENLLNKSNVSKILRQVLKKVLGYILEWSLQNVPSGEASSLQHILILALFMNCKISGDAIFALISESLARSKSSVFDSMAVYHHAMIVYSSIKDSRFDIPKLLPRFMLDLKSKSSNKKECLGHFYLLSEYLKSVNIYQLNNMGCKNKVESLLYYLSDSRFLYNVNGENQTNALLSLFSSVLDCGMFMSRLDRLELERVHQRLDTLERRLKSVLFLDSDADSSLVDADGDRLMASVPKEIDIWELTEDVYVGVLGLMVNWMGSPSELQLVLKFIRSNFDFERAGSIDRSDIRMHYITYNSLFSLLEMRNVDSRFEIPILDLYSWYSEENDQINNFLLTEMVLGDDGSKGLDLSDEIVLNRNYKLAIQTLLGSSKFGLRFGKEFHLEILENLITQIEPFSDKHLNDDQLNLLDLLHFDTEKSKNKPNPNIHLMKYKEINLHSNFISKFNSNALFVHTNTGTEFFNACGNNNLCKFHVDDNKNLFNEKDLVRIILLFRILVEDVLDVYLESIYDFSDETCVERNVKSVDIILDLINNLVILLVGNLFGRGHLVVYTFLRYYFGLISDKLYYFIRRFKDGKRTGELIFESFTMHSFKILGNFVIEFSDEIHKHMDIGLETYSHAIFLYLVMFSAKCCRLKTYYRKHLDLEQEIFGRLEIAKGPVLLTSDTRIRQRATGRLRGHRLMDYCFKQNICKRLRLLYSLSPVISDQWRLRINGILDFMEFEEVSEADKHLQTISSVLSVNSLVLELYFNHFIFSLDGQVLQIISKKVISSSTNLYSSRSIYGLLLNLALKGVHDKSKVSTGLVLHWSHINNSIKGYINQLKEDLLINIWVNYDFMHMFMLPSSLSCSFINIRIHFWTNILSIPLSRLLLHSNDDFSQVKDTLEFPLHYFRKLITLMDLDIFRENIISFSMNFVIDSTRLINLSYLSIVLKMFVSRAQNGHSSSMELEEITQLVLKLLVYMTVLSQRLIHELDSADALSDSAIAKDARSELLDNVSLLSVYLQEVSGTVSGLLTDGHQSTPTPPTDRPVAEASHEMLKKKTEWVNHLIYSGCPERSEGQAKFNTIKYIFKITSENSTSSELRRLADIFHCIKRAAPKSTVRRTPSLRLPTCSLSRVCRQTFQAVCLPSEQ
ncbi:transmembrane domain-containing protein [Cryptosporidium canis]|uniref:Transmembrane domain-containing protein n=1 Tax=Cryptosporidium canis TaxID=195482 RepID=A0ABQ8PAR5_9CRYT|nr:transmembrane domain-containing protein [Cryptosporidium canis]